VSGDAAAASAGGLGLGAGLQPAALLELRDLRLTQEPQLAPALGRDLTVSRELAQALMPDVEFIGGHGEQDQTVLHSGRFYRLRQQSTTTTLAVIQNNWYDVIGNPKELEGSVREIPLTHGMVALIDDEDYGEVSRYRWHAVQKRGGRTWYAMTNLRRADGKRTTIEMHALILGKDPEGRQVDHRDGNGLNNRRENLRYATMSEQRRNAPARRNNKTGFKGVTLHYQATGLYVAQIGTKARRLTIGYFSSAEQAARAYDDKAREWFGEFARTNFDEGLR
jgi:hypothetical protein